MGFYVWCAEYLILLSHFLPDSHKALPFLIEGRRFLGPWISCKGSLLLAHPDMNWSNFFLTYSSSFHDIWFFFSSFIRVTRSNWSVINLFLKNRNENLAFSKTSIPFVLTFFCLSLQSEEWSPFLFYISQKPCSLHAPLCTFHTGCFTFGPSLTK